MTETHNAFKAIKVGNLNLENRVVLAPLTRFRNTETHVPTPVMADYYEQRSRSPGSLLITEATFIHGAAGGYDYAPGIWSEEQVAAWKTVFDKVHANKSHIFLQLWALGRQALPSSLEKEGFDYVAPSAVAMKPNPTAAVNGDRPAPRELTVAEIKQYVKWYVAAAKNAIAAGADGVEIHCANGYLIDQFLHANTNTRTDEYGGSIVNRARFGLEVLDAVIDAVGADRVGLRISPWGGFGDVQVDISPVPQWSYFVSEIERRGIEGKRIAYLSSMEARWRQDECVFPQYMPKDVYNLNEFIGLIWTGPWIRSGQLADHIDLANRDDRTLLAIGRQYIANPDLIERLRKNLPLNKYNRDTFYWGAHVDYDRPVGYTDYPFYTEEIEGKA